jgi:hypothetical protein
VPNPTPKKRLPREIDVGSLARAYTTKMVAKLGNYALNEELKVDDEIRVRAMAMLLDRGWGRPNQPHDANLSGELRITIRKMLGDKDE